MTVTNAPRPIVLLDQPDDMYCEERGWVSVDVDADKARDLIAPFCMDEQGEQPARPVGEPKRVWLAPDDPAAPIDAQRWVPCDHSAAIGVEFWEFDATDVAPMTGEQR